MTTLVLVALLPDLLASRAHQRLQACVDEVGRPGRAGYAAATAFDLRDACTRCVQDSGLEPYISATAIHVSKTSSMARICIEYQRDFNALRVFRYQRRYNTDGCNPPPYY